MLDLERQDIGKVQRISHFSGAGYAILYRQDWHRFSIDIAKLTLAAMLKHFSVIKRSRDQTIYSYLFLSLATIKLKLRHKIISKTSRVFEA